MYDNEKIGEKMNICLFCYYDFCKRLEVLLQSCIELNPAIILIHLTTRFYFVTKTQFYLYFIYLQIMMYMIVKVNLRLKKQNG
jgi:hypothetical protein